MAESMAYSKAKSFSGICFGQMRSFNAIEFWGLIILVFTDPSAAHLVVRYIP